MKPALLCLSIVIVLSGCGGGSKSAAGSTTSTPQGPPPAQEVQSTVTTLLDKCISASFDSSADTNAVSVAVDTQIKLFKDYDPDAPLAASDLKAKTMREVLQQTRDELGKCKPEDVARVSDTLTSK